MKWEMATARRYRASYAWNREEWTCAGRVGQLVPSAVRSRNRSRDDSPGQAVLTPQVGRVPPRAGGVFRPRPSRR